MGFYFYGSWGGFRFILWLKKILGPILGFCTCLEKVCSVLNSVHAVFKYCQCDFFFFLQVVASWDNRLDAYIHNYLVKRRYNATSRIVQAKAAVPCNNTGEITLNINWIVIVSTFNKVPYYYLLFVLLIFLSALVYRYFLQSGWCIFRIGLQSLMLQAVMFLASSLLFF